MLNQRKSFLLLHIGVMLFCILGLSFAAHAQRKPAAKKPVPKATPKPNTALVVKEESQKVATQIKSLTKFIYLLGGIAQTIDDIDKDPKASVAAKKQSSTGKQTLLQSIRDMRAVIVQIEGDFHVKPELRPYIPYIQGVSEMAGVAEDQASGGQLNNAGKTLLEVVNRLTDTLLNLR